MSKCGETPQIGEVGYVFVCCLQLDMYFPLMSSTHVIYQCHIMRDNGVVVSMQGCHVTCHIVSVMLQHRVFTHYIVGVMADHIDIASSQFKHYVTCIGACLVTCHTMSLHAILWKCYEPLLLYEIMTHIRTVSLAVF